MATSLAQTKIKVDRVQLIAALKTVLTHGDSDYRRAVQRYETAVEKAEAEITAKLKTLVVNGNVKIKDHYGGYPAELTVSSKTKIPQKPRDVACDLRRTIEVLELSLEETVPLSAEQYERFFPCKADDE